MTVSFARSGRLTLLFLTGIIFTGRWYDCDAKVGADELEPRYWKSLNEGHDLTSLTPLIEQIVFPHVRKRPLDQLRQDATEQLKRIETTRPLDALINAAAPPACAPQHGADWLTLGGNIAHTGATDEPGPVRGELAWKYAIGWPWDAAPLIDAHRVYSASPAITTALMCFDRTDGTLLWSTPNPRGGFNRRIRSASPVLKLSASELTVYQESFDGWPLMHLVINQSNGHLARQVPAHMQETSTERFESDPGQLVAHRFMRGEQILVKSLQSGRTWWRFPTGYLPDDPLLSDEQVFCAAENGTLWALNLLGDQRIAWQFENTAGWGSTPAVDDHTVYIGGNDGVIYALDKKTGAPLWRTRIAQPDPRSRRLFTTPRVTGERVYIGAANGSLHAIRTADGQEMWRHDCGDWLRARPFAFNNNVFVASLEGRVIGVRDLGELAQPLWDKRASPFSIYADLAGDEEGVIVSTSDFDLVSLDLQSGAIQWRQSLVDCTRNNDVKVCADSMPDIMQAPVVVSQGQVISAGRNGFVQAVDATTGERRWRFENGGRISATPTADGRRVFVGQVGGNKLLYALDAATGTPLWHRSLGEIWCPIECDGEQVFVGNKDHSFYCLDPNDGSTLWTRDFGDGIYPAPAVDNEAIYTGSWDGHYYALERDTGRIRWAFSRPGHPYHTGGRPDSAAPILAAELAIVPSLGGRLVALHKTTGQLKWEWFSLPWRICNATPATNGNLVLISHFGNAYELPFDVHLLAVDLSSGQQRWRIPGPGGLTAPVLTGGDRFVAGSLGSPFIYGYQLPEEENEEPELLWRFKTGGVMYESLPAVSGNFGYFLSNDGWLRALK